MLIRNYNRRNKIANTLFAGGLVSTITCILCIGGLAVSYSNIKDKIESLPRYMEATRQTCEQDLKNNNNLNYAVSALGLLSVGASALGNKLHREN